jgi:hypothetical protein
MPFLVRRELPATSREQLSLERRDFRERVTQAVETRQRLLRAERALLRIDGMSELLLSSTDAIAANLDVEVDTIPTPAGGGVHAEIVQRFEIIVYNFLATVAVMSERQSVLRGRVNDLLSVLSEEIIFASEEEADQLEPLGMAGHVARAETLFTRIPVEVTDPGPLSLQAIGSVQGPLRRRPPQGEEYHQSSYPQ